MSEGGEVQRRSRGAVDDDGPNIRTVELYEKTGEVEKHMMAVQGVYLDSQGSVSCPVRGTELRLNTLRS